MSYFQAAGTLQISRKVLMIACFRLAALTLSLWLTSCALEPASVPVEQPEQAARQGQASSSEARYVLEGPLRVMTLNLAHGRKDGINQLLLGEQTIRQNLSTVHLSPKPRVPVWLQPARPLS